MKRYTKIFFVVGLLCLLARNEGRSQGNATRDTIIYHYIYRDTIVYRYDTVTVIHYYDTIHKNSKPVAADAPKKKGWYNPTSWGIGPMMGAYYSPYHGFDFNIGFGIQYYLFAVPSFRNPHMGSRGKRKQ